MVRDTKGEYADATYRRDVRINLRKTLDFVTKHLAKVGTGFTGYIELANFKTPERSANCAQLENIFTFKYKIFCETQSVSVLDCSTRVS